MALSPNPVPASRLPQPACRRTGPPWVFGPPKRGADPLLWLRRAARARGSACQRRQGRFPLTPLSARAIFSRRLSTPNRSANGQPLFHSPTVFPGRTPPGAVAPIGRTGCTSLPALGSSLQNREAALSGLRRNASLAACLKRIPQSRARNEVSLFTADQHGPIQAHRYARNHYVFRMFRLVIPATPCNSVRHCAA